jgi:hypothetical protein
MLRVVGGGFRSRCVVECCLGCRTITHIVKDLAYGQAYAVSSFQLAARRRKLLTPAPGADVKPFGRDVPSYAVNTGLFSQIGSDNSSYGSVKYLHLARSNTN